MLLKAAARELRRKLIQCVLFSVIGFVVVESVEAAPRIGIFFDRAGTISSGVIGPNTSVTFYVLAFPDDLGGLWGASFRVDGMPTDWVVSATPSPDYDLTIGNPLTGGCEITLRSCQTGSPILLYTLSGLATTAPPPSTFLQVRENPRGDPAFSCPYFYNCSDPVGLNCVLTQSAALIPDRAPGFDAPPTPACGSKLSIEATQTLSFTIQVSDPDAGDVVTLTSEALPSGSTLTPALPQEGNPVSSVLSWTPKPADVGLHTPRFTATDSHGLSVECRFDIEVTPSNTAVACDHALASEPTLSPADNSFHAISIAGVTDPDGDPVTITVTGITQDEPVISGHSGSICPDAQIIDGRAFVRAERTVTRGIRPNGRVYAIQFTASDGRGGDCTGSVSVCVPYSLRPPAVCIDDGQNYNSLGSCAGTSLLSQEIAAVTLSVGEVTATRAMLEFALPEEAQVEISVYDVAGRRLATVEKGLLAAGVYQRGWDVGSAPKGIYFVRLRAGATTLTKMVIRAH